ncbi:MAG: hypothetical protein R3E12_19760 [Candidatus Eisenbacteria bacterium]
MRIPRALLAASAFAIATWAVWGSHRADPSGHGTPARPETRAIATGEDSAGEALHGPELIVEYFRRWHEPYPADLDRSTLGRIWNEIAALPTEPGSAGQQVSRPIGDRTQVRRGGGSASWTLLGPFGMETPQSHRFSGRIVDLNVGPSGLRAVAAASGGLWERGPSEWSSHIDGRRPRWTGSLDIHPSNPSTLILGSGEPFIRAGTGFCKSTDGGATWVRKAMSPRPRPVSVSATPRTGRPCTVHSIRLLPIDERRRDVDAHPQPQCLADGHGAASDEPERALPDRLGSGTLPLHERRADLERAHGDRLPQTDIGRGAITICDADPNRMYLAHAHTNGNLLGTFRSTDGGAT